LDRILPSRSTLAGREFDFGKGLPCGARTRERRVASKNKMSVQFNSVQGAHFGRSLFYLLPDTGPHATAKRPPGRHPNSTGGAPNWLVLTSVWFGLVFFHGVFSFHGSLEPPPTRGSKQEKPPFGSPSCTRHALRDEGELSRFPRIPDLQDSQTPFIPLGPRPCPADKTCLA
jgi:hypothetical protein